MLFIQTFVSQQMLNRTIRKLQTLPPRVGRKAVSKGVFKAGKVSLVESRAAAPRGKTGQFKRSMGQKNIRYAAKSTYQSLVGHRYDKRRSTARRYQPAGPRGGMISRGLSGRGSAPAIWWLDRGTKAHTIKPKNSRWLSWNIAAGGKKFKPNRFSRYGVRHPGHRGTGFMNRLAKQRKPKNLTIVRKEVLDEVRRLGYSI